MFNPTPEELRQALAAAEADVDRLTIRVNKLLQTVRLYEEENEALTFQLGQEG